MASESLKNKAVVFAAAMAAGSGPRHAAVQAGISERTAFRWLKKESIQKRINTLHDHATSRAMAILTSAKVGAAVALAKAARGGDVRAMRIILVDVPAMADKAAPAAAAAGASDGGGLVVPGLDVRWQTGAGPEGGQAP